MKGKPSGVVHRYFLASVIIFGAMLGSGSRVLGLGVWGQNPSGANDNNRLPFQLHKKEGLVNVVV